MESPKVRTKNGMLVGTGTSVLTIIVCTDCSLNQYTL